jgi:hypothetical protein
MRILLLFVAAARADRVEWSDGRTWEGTVELAPQARLRLHDGERVREWDKAAVARMNWRPATQRMERAWQFIEAGKTAKQFTGQEYPTEELEATVTLISGERISGHLLTTVLYLTKAEQTDKLVIPHKLRGREGERFESIIFPMEINFDAIGAAPARHGPVEVEIADAHAGALLAAVNRTDMSAGRVTPLGRGRFQVSISGADVILAIQTGNQITVGWRGAAAPEAARRRVEQGLRDLRDFFDDRRLMALSADPHDPSTAWSLLLLTRSSPTTLDGKATLPWRLEVWKWRLGEAADDLTAAARVVLFRGIRSRQTPLPEVRMDDVLAAFEQVRHGDLLKTRKLEE